MRPLTTHQIGAINQIKFFTVKMQDFRNGVQEVECQWLGDDFEMKEIVLTPEQVEKRISEYKSSIKAYAKLHAIEADLEERGIVWDYQ